MADACPISGRRVDQNACRVVAASVALLVAAAIYFRMPVLLLLLTIDFFLRGWDRAELSILSRSAKALVKCFGLKPQLTDGAPKRFAARIGSLLSMVAGTLLLTTHSPAPGIAVAFVLIACAGLEALAGVCVGCGMYSMLPKRLSEILAR